MCQSLIESVILTDTVYYQKDYTKQLYVSAGQDSHVMIQMPDTHGRD